MNTLFILYVYSALAFTNVNPNTVPRDWVKRDYFGSQEHCVKAGNELGAIYKCIDSGIPVDAKWVK